MSITVNNITSKNIVALENIASNQSVQIKQLTDLFLEKNKRKYDQTTKQDVIISFSQEKYRFEIQKPENDVYIYQVWKKNNDSMNSQRKYKYLRLKNWITTVFKNETNFTPTTLIEINNNFYTAVLVDAKIEQKLVNNVMTDYCVFIFDTRPIISPSNRSLLSLPNSGSYKNVRFDIDSLTNSSSVIQQLIDGVMRPLLGTININSYTVPLNITFPNISVNQDGGVFKMDVSASNFSVTINNIQNTQVAFTQYYMGKLAFDIPNIQCTIGIGSLNFSNIHLLGTSYADNNFSNIQIPINMQAILLFDYKNCTNNSIMITPLSDEIFLPYSMQSNWVTYWDNKIDDAEDAALFPPVSVYYGALAYAIETQIQPVFWNQLNSQADLKTNINSKLSDITNMINSSINGPYISSLCSQYQPIISIISQVNLNAWDFSTILCGSDDCTTNRYQNYLIATTDTPFPNTNFPSNQLYIVKSDTTTCYAINMQQSNINALTNMSMFPPIANITGTYPAAYLLRTNAPDGTIIILNPGIWISTSNTGDGTLLTNILNGL